MTASEEMALKGVPLGSFGNGTTLSEKHVIQLAFSLKDRHYPRLVIASL
jgi:hypothetical protein